MITRIILVFLLIQLFCGQACAQEMLQVPAAIHISSTISEGKYTIDEIAEIVKNNGSKVLIITDYYLSRLRYGIWPLRNVIKKTVEFNSVSRYGVKRYLEEINNAQLKNPGLVFIPAVEVAPFYYWAGNVLNSSLKIKDWHKHLLVIGLEKEKDYQGLPALGNDRALTLPFAYQDLIMLWPLLLLWLGFLYYRKSKFCRQALSARAFHYSKIFGIVGTLLLIVGLIFLWNNFPFCRFRFNQYAGDLGIKPYQFFIDYVRSRSGMTFWAHPEAENIERTEQLKIETQEYVSDLEQVQDYDGFAIFYEGYKKIGCPGCLWDEMLMQYCRGVRKTPVWAIAGLSFDNMGDLNLAFRDLRTVLLLPALNKKEVLGALRHGSMYVSRGSDSGKFILDEFSIKDSLGNASGGMGETLSLSGGNAEIKIKGHFLAQGQGDIKIKLIRNGKVIKIFEVAAPFELAYNDEDKIASNKAYYRLELESRNLLLVTNPIFVERKGLK